MTMERSSEGAGSGRFVAGIGLAIVVVAGGADGVGVDFEGISRHAHRLIRQGLAWYTKTPPGERVVWSILATCATMSLLVTLGKWWMTRRGKILPGRFVSRFATRLEAGKLDRGKGTDLCELNPSPAARVALAAVRRWGRPVGDLERAVELALRVETGGLRRHVGTVRRMATLMPLVGLLGTLLAAGRILEVPGGALGTAWGAALAPLTAGVALGIVALLIHDGLMGRVEGLTLDLDRFGAETIDAILVATEGETSRLVIRGPHLPADAR